MKNLEYEVVKDAVMIDEILYDAVSVNEYWIPIKKNQVVETGLFGGYRYIVVDGFHYQFHRSIHETGRPQLLNEILDLMKVINH